MGKRAERELNSIAICTEATGRFEENEGIRMGLDAKGD